MAKAAIALGSNLGDSYRILENAIRLLNQTPGIQVHKQSSWYITEPIGPPQPDYLNGCALLEVTLTPQELLTQLLAIETKFGRVRRERWQARTLDLDLLLFENLILNELTLEIPHPRMRQRAFVLVPLAEIIPDWIDPVTGKAIATLLKAVDCSGVHSFNDSSFITSMPLQYEPSEQLNQRLAYQGRKFSFDVTTLRLPNGAVGDWECIRHPGGALAIPVTPEGKLVLVRQYRFAANGRLLEFPAGTIEPNEDPAETIKREIEEETGYRAKKWQKLGQFFLAPGYSDEIIYAFLAQDLERLETPPHQDEDEDMETVLLTPQELEQAILDGEPVDAKSISSFFLARPLLTA